MAALRSELGAESALRELVEVAQRLTGAAAAYVAVPGGHGPQVLAWTGHAPDPARVRFVEAPVGGRACARAPLPGSGGVLAVWGGRPLALDLHLPALCVLADTVAARLARTRPTSDAAVDRAELLRHTARAVARGPLALLVLATAPGAGAAGLAEPELGDEVTRRLRTQLRPADVLAHLADARWSVLLADLPAGARYVALGVADRLSRSLTGPLDSASGPPLAVASTGLTFSTGADDEPPVLLAQAEHAATVAVRRGPGRYHVHRASRPTDPTDDGQVERLLRDALDDGALVVHYQPVVDLTARDVVGVEALVRLRAHDGTLVPPDRFIPIAERCGLIAALGDQVRRTAMQTVAAWKTALPHDVELGLGVNLSVHELEQPGLVASLRSALDESGLDPVSLNLEITESAFLEEGRGHEGVLAELRSLGPKLFIDDFGTGFSSLSYLRRFPVDGLKIDRTFVGDLLSGPQPRAVTGAIVHLAQELGVHVVAEGVETEQQADLLTGHGCGLAQGYLFSRPVPAEEACALLVPGPRVAVD